MKNITKLGPYDGRKKRSRCLACATSHIKCSGQTPCAACTRRSVDCRYPPSRAASDGPVIVESSYSHSHYSRKKIEPVQRHLPADPTAFYLYHFYVFVQRNDFTGKAAAVVQTDLQHLGRLGTGTFLRDAMLAIGSMQAATTMQGHVALDTESLKSSTPPPDESTRLRRIALEYYARAVSSLSSALAENANSADPSSTSEDTRDTILWTTLFLGFYELMNNARARGWQMHMIHGTAKALRALGPQSVRSSRRSRTFFLQARVFEVYRAIIFSDSTFLTDPEWQNLMGEIWMHSCEDNKEREGWHPMDSLLDIIVLCSRLRYRIRGFLPNCHRMTADEIGARGREIAAEAASLRQALNRWYDIHIKSADDDRLSAITPSTTSPATPASSSSKTAADTHDSSIILGRLFYASASIYLSGIFDWEIDQWQAIEVDVPVLSRDQIDAHVDAILQHAPTALACTNIPPVLLMFHIRIAGARARCPVKRDLVLRLLDDVRRMYAAASFYTTHLQNLWAKMARDEAEGIPLRSVTKPLPDTALTAL